MWPWGTAIAISLLVSCASPGAFVCESDDQCMRGGQQGQCQGDGYCSYPDEDCPSGYRFEKDAGGGVGGECVPESSDTSTTSTSTSSSSSTTSTSTETGVVDDTTSGDTTSGTTSTSTTSSETTGTSTTTGDCFDDPNPGRCGMCLIVNCCQELMACQLDPACDCIVACVDGGQDLGVCENQCGQTDVYTVLLDCSNMHCTQVCPGG